MIGVLGINHTSAPIEVRERFSISDDEIAVFADFLCKHSHISSIVVLSTCNRTEIYFSQSQFELKHAHILVYNSLMAFKTIDFDAEQYVYSYNQDDAVEHLFTVTSGIDSMLIGEDQIIGQVKEAYEIAEKYSLPDAVLKRLFQKSLEAGKRVRTETAITTGCTSISFLAVEMCDSVCTDLSKLSVLLIGTGDTGKLTLQALYKKGVRDLYISNRTYEHALPLVEKYDAEFVPINQIDSYIEQVDIVITATSSSSYIITSDMLLEKSLQSLPIFVDLSVPRNIDLAIDSISKVEIIVVDDLQKIIDRNKEKREDCVEQAYEIIQETCAAFMDWFSFRALQPTIRAIDYHLEKIYSRELATYSLGSSSEIVQSVDDFSANLRKKYKKELIKNVRQITNNGRNELYLQVINDLFRQPKTSQ
ncbi:MAG: glutamyl-tRNA reductase [Bacteroidales bacterium]|jgi:glutamyl-tRNA reductase|nr:glutamyl-tRNA reductase [Bacteroidales bacterium]